MRNSVLVTILIVLSACQYSPSLPAPKTSPVTESQPVTSAPATVLFKQVTPTPAAGLRDRNEALGKTAQNRAYENGEPLAARVNNRPLLLDTFERHTERFEQALVERGVDLSTSQGQAQLSQIQKQVLQNLLDQYIIEQKAIDFGIIVTEEELANKTQETVAQIADQAQFEDWLAVNSLSYEEFTAVLKSQLITGQVFHEITRGIPETAEQVQVQYIGVANRQAAQEMITRIVNGTSFSVLAQEEASTSANGGKQAEWIPKGTGLVPARVEEVAFDLQPGEISGPIQDSDIFYIIKLEDREANRPLSSSTLQLLKNRIFEDWLDKQRSSTVIEKFVDL